jgi:hypothetical protein
VVLPEVVLNPKYAGPASVAEVKATFEKTVGNPYPHCLLRDVLDERFLEGLKDEVKDLHYLQKSNDLYDFLQSNDLKGCASPHVSKLKELLYSTDFRSWLQAITGIEVCLQCRECARTHARRGGLTAWVGPGTERHNRHVVREIRGWVDAAVPRRRTRGQAHCLHSLPRSQGLERRGRVQAHARTHAHRPQWKTI